MSDHFPDVKKMVDLGSGRLREIEDILLTRYACYLMAQTCFAVQTRIHPYLRQILKNALM